MTEQNDMNPATPIAPRLMSVEPILAVRDIGDATRYYHEILGFDEVWQWGDPPSHGGAVSDGVHLQFSLNPALAAKAEGQGIWINVRNVAALYARHQERGAEIVSALEPKPWGLSEYTVRDLNGYRLRLAGGAASPDSLGGLPPSLRIESRLPTWPEMKALIRAVGWEDAATPDAAPRVLRAALFGAVAIADEQTVGCAFLTTDNAGFYYVRDVMVHPDWQRRSIGTALMQTLMDYLHAHAPKGALVGLFTGSDLHGFYARFGFRGPDGGLYGMTQVIR